MNKPHKPSIVANIKTDSNRKRKVSVFQDEKKWEESQTGPDCI